MAVASPGPDELPPGPHRDLVEAIHALYDLAGKPSARVISLAIRKDGTLGEAASHETISALLRGTSFPSWRRGESIVIVLNRMCQRPEDESRLLPRFQALWLRAESTRSAAQQAPSPFSSGPVGGMYQGAPAPPVPGDAPFSSAPRTLAVPAYDADQVDDGPQDDLIGIAVEVDAFAHLLAARQLTPPLAVGLFGEWGSGKSFFMRTLRARIDALTRTARQQPQQQSIHPRIAQIEFNAWHYVEGNLWASLVAHIFDNLRTSPEEHTAELRRRRATVAAELASTQEVQERTAVRLTALAQQIEGAELALAELHEAQEKKLTELKDLRLRTVAQAIVIPAGEAKSIQNSLDEIGVTAVGTKAEELAAAVERARDLVRRGGATGGVFLRRGWRWTLLVGVAVLAAPVMSIVLSHLDLTGTTRAAGTVAAFLAAAAAVLNRGVGWSAQMLDRLDRADQSLRARLFTAEALHAARIDAVKSELDGLRVEENALRRTQEDAEHAAARIREKLAQLTPARMLAQFVSERGDTDDYRKLLGLTALVRRDFDQLSRLVTEYNTAGDAQETGLDFNRIVLYIDDLDRCPAPRVVEVLHAIHLLLSFPIFVVVVAVDGRWLGRSLDLEHPEMFGVAGPGALHGPSATSQDYLEKIFQIPFWVPRLDVAARRRLIMGLADVDPESLSTTTVLPVQTPADLDDDETDEDEPYLEISSLEIDAADLSAIDSLTPLLGDSPRAIKRFLNVFRLVKGIALGGTRPIDSVEERYRVLLLLAVVTGMPEAAAVLLPAMSKMGEESLPELVNMLYRDIKDPVVLRDLEQLIDWLVTTPVPAETLDLVALRPWIPTIARYSFYAPVGS